MEDSERTLLNKMGTQAGIKLEELAKLEKFIDERLAALETRKTEAVSNCKTFTELEAVIRQHEPFVSHSRTEPVEWKANDLIHRIFAVIDGGLATNVTRANGLRAKVTELRNLIKIDIKENKRDIKDEDTERLFFR